MKTPQKNNLRTPIVFVKYILAVYESRNMNPEPALQKAQITSYNLKKSTAYISAHQFEKLSSYAMQELDDEGLGWFQRRLPWGSYGMLARASMTSATLGLAIARWCRHHNILVRELQLDIRQNMNLTRLRFAERYKLTFAREFAFLTLMRNLYGLSCWLVDSQITLQEVRLPFSAPDYKDLFVRLFPGPVTFNAPVAELRFDPAYLQMRLRRNGADVDRMLKRALPIIIWPYRPDRLLALQVRSLLKQSAGSKIIEDIADKLHMSSRTLQRRLKLEKTSFQELKNSVYSEKSCELLLQTSRSIKQISHDVGFANDKSFSRAFLMWTGKSPSDYRAHGG